MTLKESFIAFCDNSTIHGISFWSSTQSIFQKILWVFIVILGIFSASFMIWNNFQTWAANPVVVSVVQVPIEQAPYPSVTICPLENTPFGSIEDIVDQAYGSNPMIRNKTMSVLQDFVLGHLRKIWDEGRMAGKDECHSSICEENVYNTSQECLLNNIMFQNIETQLASTRDDIDLLQRDVLGLFLSSRELEFDESREIRESFQRDEQDLCKRIYVYSKALISVKEMDVLNGNIGGSLRVGSVLSWLYNHVDDLNNPSLGNELRQRVEDILNPSQMPETSSRRRFETFDDIFLPWLAEMLIGGPNSKKNLNVQGLEYSRDLYNMMKYSQSPMEVLQNSGEVNPKPGIPFCLFASSDEKGEKLGGYPERFCQSMQPIMNEDGLCYTYNNVDFKMEPESNEFDEPLVNIQGVGHKKGLTLVVDSQMMKNRARKAVSDYEGFKVIVTVPGAIAAKVSFIVEPDYPGEHSFYLHGIHYITASQDVIDWNKDAQVCYLPQNKELTYYSHYLQDNCLQECKLKKISNQCSCSPWFINQTKFPICNDIGMSCFKNKAANYQDDLIDRTECDCKNDCEMVHFFYSMRQEGYNREWFNPKDGGSGYLSNYLLDPNGVFHEPLTHNLTKILYDMNDLDIARDRYTRDIMIMNFFFDTPIISNFNLEMKVTIFDQISAIGGTLGLFAGVSLISMFEIVFWFFKAFLEKGLGLLGLGRVSSASSIEPLTVKGTDFRRPIFQQTF